MNLIELIKLGITVACQKEVIIALAVMIVSVALANYVIRYRKKPPKQKKNAKKTEAAKPSNSAQPGEAAAAEGNPPAQG